MKEWSYGGGKYIPNIQDIQPGLTIPQPLYTAHYQSHPSIELSSPGDSSVHIYPPLHTQTYALVHHSSVMLLDVSIYQARGQT